MFCSTCGTLLQLKKTPYGKWMSCPHHHPQPKLVQETEIQKSKNTTPTLPIGVASGENILAVYDHKCPKCSHGKAELVEMGPSYSDEDSTFRMKCGKCGWVERLEGKVK